MDNSAMGILEGKHALVTGGGTGIGAAISLSLARAGADVTICGRRLGTLEEQAFKHDKIQPVQGDICDPQSVKQMFERARDKFGPVDIVVANAGAAQSASFANTDLDLWNKMLEVNLTGTFLTLKEGLAEMKEAGWGRMITIASTAGLKGSSYISAYCAAKHGVVGLTRSLAVELAKSGITVNAVCPGYTETQIVKTSIVNIMEKTGRDESHARAFLTKSNPVGRIITPQEVAAAVLWLVGPGSDAIIGQSISVSGGETW